MTRLAVFVVVSASLALSVAFAVESGARWGGWLDGTFGAGLALLMHWVCNDQ